MARRESQGLQITLIIFVMLAIVFLVATIVLWNKTKNLVAENQKLQTDINTANTASQTALDQQMKMKVWLGHTAQTAIEEIEAQYNRDMGTYARSANEVQRNYKDVPALLFTALQARNKQIADMREQLKQTQDEFATAKQQLQAAADEAKKMAAAKEAELLETRQQFAAEREQLNQQKSEQAASIEKARAEMADLQTKTDQQVQTLQRDVRNQRTVIDQQRDKIKSVTDETFEVPDGKITWVNPRSGTAYINLGSADGLRTQVNFNVYAMDANSVAAAKRKGTLEITRVVDEHLAEGRLTIEDGAEAVLAGDVVYTPLWTADSAMHFALAGKMDFDDDGRDDRELIRRLIQLNGGTIDAEDKNGEVTGQVTRNTRYLIRGVAPEAGDGGRREEGDPQKAWTAILNQANDYGLEELNLQQLMDYLGFDGEKRTVPLGAGEQTPKEPAATAKPGATDSADDRATGGFRPRRPPNVLVP